MIKNFLTKSRWLVTIILLLSLGIGQIWGADSGLTASPGVFIFDFYNSTALDATDGTNLSLANCTTHVKVPTGITASSVVTAVSSSGTYKIDKNGGLTWGGSSTSWSYTTFTIGSNFPVRNIKVVAAKWENIALCVNSTEVTANTKGTAYASCAAPTNVSCNFLTSLRFGNTLTASGTKKKRITLYTAVCEYGYRAYLTTPSEGSISAAPKTTNENGAGWNGTEGAVVGLKSGQKVTLSVSSTPSGKVFDSWTIKKKSDNSDITATVLDGNTLTMPAYDVTVSVTWASASSCGVPTVGAPSNSSFF